MTSITRFCQDENGATSIEYSLIAVIVSIVIISSLNSYANTLNGTFSKVSSTLSTANK